MSKKLVQVEVRYNAMIPFKMEITKEEILEVLKEEFKIINKTTGEETDLFTIKAIEVESL